MHYEKNQYSEGASICGLIIAGMFLYWGFNTLFGFSPSPFSWWWLGFIWILIGLAIISGQIAALSNRGRLRSIVKDYFMENPNASIEEISVHTGISVKDVRAIVLDLKARRELRGKFSTKTGQMKTIPVESEPSESSEPAKGSFCSNCGTAVKDESAMYCAYCGARL